MDDPLRALLIEVAEGRLDPAQAVRRLDEAQPPSQPAAATPARTAGSGPTPVRRVVVQASARPIRVVADLGVATVSVDGPHSVRGDGDTLVVDAGPGAERGDGAFRFERKGGFARWLGQASSLGVPVTVRVNPQLDLQVELAAGALEVVGLRGALGFSVVGSSVKVRDCTGPLTGVVRAGSAKLDLRPVTGVHSVRVETGSIDLRLQPGSDVRVRARVELGEVKLKSTDGQTQALGVEGHREAVFGAGTAQFDLDVVMGSAKVRTP